MADPSIGFFKKCRSFVRCFSCKRAVFFGERFLAKALTKERKGVDKSNVFPYNSNCVWKKDGKIINMVARVAQLVEHNLAKVGAAGSSPVSRLFFCGGKSYKWGFPIFLPSEIL